MSRRPSATAIGAFLVAALLLLAGGVALLGGARWFSSRDIFVIHFDEPLQGLRPGAAVTFRGVAIGQVVSIRAVLDPGGNGARVPVTVELDKGAVELADGGEPTPETIRALIDRGLRARLELESLVTARLLVGLDFYPGSPMTLVGGEGGPPEIPSTRSQIAGLSRGLDTFTMAAPELLSQTTDLLSDLRDILGGDTGRELRRAIRSTSALAETLGAPDGPLRRTLADLPATLAGLRETAADADALVARLDALVGGNEPELQALLGDAAKTAASVRRAADGASVVLSQNREALQEFSNRGLPELAGLVEDATRMVNEVSGLVRDVRQNPARFFFGEPTREGVRLR